MAPVSESECTMRDCRVPAFGCSGAVLRVVRVEVVLVEVASGETRASRATRCGKLGAGSARAAREGPASGARTALPTTSYDGASEHLGNAFATHPLRLAGRTLERE